MWCKVPDQNKIQELGICADSWEAVCWLLIKAWEFFFDISLAINFWKLTIAIKYNAQKSSLDCSSKAQI